MGSPRRASISVYLLSAVRQLLFTDFLFVFFKAGFLCVVLAVLELTL